MTTEAEDRQSTQESEPPQSQGRQPQGHQTNMLREDHKQENESNGRQDGSGSLGQALQQQIADAIAPVIDDLQQQIADAVRQQIQQAEQMDQQQVQEQVDQGLEPVRRQVQQQVEQTIEEATKDQAPQTSLQEAIQQTVKALKQTVQWLAKTLRALLKTVVSLLTAVVALLKVVLLALWEGVKFVVKPVGRGIGFGFGALVNGLTSVLGRVFTALKSWIANLLHKLADALRLEDEADSDKQQSGRPDNQTRAQQGSRQDTQQGEQQGTQQGRQQSQEAAA